MEDTFEDFLLKTESQKEVSLVIVQEDQDIEEIIEVLEKFQYKNMVNLPSLLKEIERPSRVCVFLEKVFPRKLYDFISQYPTGNIEVYDNETSGSQVAFPLYDGVSIVVVAKQSALDYAKRLGYSVLEKVGLTFRKS